MMMLKAFGVGVNMMLAESVDKWRFCEGFLILAIVGGLIYNVISEVLNCGYLLSHQGKFL